MRTRRRARIVSRGARPPTPLRPSSRPVTNEGPPGAIATQLQVPRSTVAAVLVRVGLNRLARLEPPAPVHRYERTRPGELVHLDSSHSDALCASDTASIRTGAAASAPAGNTSTSRWMTTVARPTSKCCRTRRAPPRRASYDEPSVGSRAAASPSRACSPKRQWVHQSALSGRRGAMPCPTHPHAALSPPNQRQGRTFHPDPDPRLGVRGGLSELLASNTRAPALASPLQRREAARGSRLSTAARPLSEGCSVINLVRSHS